MRLSVLRSVVAVFMTSVIVVGISSWAMHEEAQAAPANPMTLVFQTQQMNETISITLGGELDNVVINWGILDSGGTPIIESVTNQAAGSGDVTLTQTAEFDGTYQVTITATKLEHFGKCTNGSDSTLTRVTTWGSFGLTSLRCAFNYRAGLVEVPSTLPGTVTDLSYAFAYANAFNQDISGWETSNVSNMQSMFENAVSFNQSLASWNISNVTNMTDIFRKINYYSMSNENYSATLASWGNQTVQPNVNTGVVTMQAVTCAAVQGRAALLASPNNWTISDVAPTLDCPQGDNQNSGGGDVASSSAQLAHTGSSQNAIVGLSWILLLFGAISLGFARKQKALR